MEGYYEIKAYIIIENIILDYNKNQIKKMTYDDIFLDINKLIDKVLKDNKKRENFYKTLNKKLEILNESLDNI